MHDWLDSQLSNSYETTSTAHLLDPDILGAFGSPAEDATIPAFNNYNTSTPNHSSRTTLQMRPQQVMPANLEDSEGHYDFEEPYLHHSAMVSRVHPLSASGVNGNHQSQTLSPNREDFTEFVNTLALDTADEVLNEPTADSDTIFDSLKNAHEWRSAFGESESGEEIDDTIPKTDQQIRACVKLLFKAFMCVTKAEDNAPIIKPFEIQRHDPKCIEAMCWGIYEALKLRSEKGRLLAAYDKEGASPTMTFEDRLQAAVIAMSTEKTICKHLYDAPFVNVFVDDPVRAKSRVVSNRNLNRIKGERMALGKVAQETLQSEKSPVRTPRSGRKRTRVAEDDDEVEVYGISAGSPRLRTPSKKSGKSQAARAKPQPPSTPSVYTPSPESSTNSYQISPQVKRETESYNGYIQSPISGRSMAQDNHVGGYSLNPVPSPAFPRRVPVTNPFAGPAYLRGQLSSTHYMGGNIGAIHGGSGALGSPFVGPNQTPTLRNQGFVTGHHRNTHLNGHLTPEDDLAIGYSPLSQSGHLSTLHDQEAQDGKDSI